MPVVTLIKTLLAFWVVLLSFACYASATTAPASATETTRLKQWLDARYEEELQRKPTTLTRLGRKDLYSQIDNYSREGQEEYLRWMSATGTALSEQFEYLALSVEGKVSYDFWMYRVQEMESGFAFRDHKYVMTTWSEMHTVPVSFMVNAHVVESEDDMLAYIARIEGWGRALQQMMDRVEYSAAKGIRPPRFSYHDVIAQSRLVIEGTPFSKAATESSLWADAKHKINVLVQTGKIDSRRAVELEQNVKQALLEHFQPAYQRIIGWHEQDLKNTAEQAQGVHSLPNGKSYYEHQLVVNTQSSMTPDEVHSLGLIEVGRIQAEMNAIMKRVGFEDSLQEFFDYVREDERFYYPDTDAGREAYIEETRRQLNKMEALLPQYFGRLPLAPLEVRRVEPYRELDGAAAWYYEGTADGSRPGVYYLHLSDMKAMNRVDLETTAYHEGSPGHHMQGSIAMENDALPLFRRVEWSNAYGEGWALYSEYLAKEMGAFHDPYMDFGRLVNELWRALRLVVDSGLHALGWTEDQAIAYMLNNSSSPETTVRSEVQRYLLSPGQASSYKAGMLRIQAMRAKAEQQMGEQFDIRGFHDLILAGGSLPLPVLERRVDVWIAENSD
ncbi:MAG: DUF885 domain-containing protein [Halioglobus sp.]